MPLGKNIRYRFRRVSSKESVRLAFKGNKVVESVVFKMVGGKLMKIKGE